MNTPLHTVADYPIRITDGSSFLSFMPTNDFVYMCTCEFSPKNLLQQMDSESLFSVDAYGAACQRG